MSKKPYTSLTFEKRQIIENMAKKKQTPQRIAEATGVHVATIYREMKRGQTKDGYSAIKAQCEVLRYYGSTDRPFYKGYIFGVGQQVFGSVFKVKTEQRWRTRTLKKVP